MFEILLKKVAEQLDGQGLPYMIIGGQAVLLYGEPRLTGDIDITLGISVDQLSRLEAVLPRIGLKPLVDPGKFAGKTMVLPCQELDSGIRVDFIFSFTPYEQEAIKRAHHIVIGNQKVCFASPEDLIVHKMIAGRPRDIEDVRGIMFKNQGLDIDYIRGWLIQFSESLTQPFLQHFETLLSETRLPSSL